MPRYEVGIFNEEVRERLKNGERHRFLTDDWADIHYIETNASTEESARKKLMSRYSPDQGYVVVSLEEIEG